MMDPKKLEALWPVAEPPNGFAERVVSRALDERRRSRKKPLLLSAAAIAAAAVALLLAWPRPVPSGERLATAREEVALGERAAAVLEPQARISWRGGAVEQATGDVFYRVEPGTEFRVTTPTGDVTVTGTCFRVRVRPGTEAKEGSDMKRQAIGIASGAAIGALAVITVYEGKVGISHAGEKVELSAGQSGKLDSNGAERLEGDAALGAAERALAIAPADRGEYVKANDELARDIAELNRRLRSIETEKKDLQSKLEAARAVADGGTPRTRSEFDLDQDDWSALAKDGTVKYRVPCFRSGGWTPKPETLDALGLAPHDADALRDAYTKSNTRMWDTIRRLCVQAIGKEDIVEVLGPDTCTHVIVDMERKKDGEAAKEAMRQVAEIRAGLRAPPAPGEPMNPTLEVFLALTGELPRFEADLAQSFGPEEAHRLAYSADMCASHSTFGGPGPRNPKP